MGLFSEFLLSVESMEPGQLSIPLYSVCKIQNLNTESLSVDVGFFFFSTTYSVPSVRIMSVFLLLLSFQILEACDSGGWF